MADELDLDQLDSDQEEKYRGDKRIKDLSEKVRLTTEERDEQKRLLGERDVKIAELERENAFNSGFVDVLTKHPMAKDHKDDILVKVKGGYSVEDATYAVLGKVGKLGQPPPPPVDNPAGGSAVNSPVLGEKTLKELTRDEKRAKLVELEARGDISIT